MSAPQQDPMKRLIYELDLDCGNADAVALAIDALIQARIKEALVNLMNPATFSTFTGIESLSSGGTVMLGGSFPFIPHEST